MSRAYAAIVLIALFLGGLAVAYRKGYQAHATEAKAELADHLGRAIEQANQVAAQDREIMLAGDARVAEVRAESRKIERKVTDYGRANTDAVPCLDARGLCLWAAINAGRIADAACDGVDAGQVPQGAAAAGLGQGPGPSGGSPAAGGAVPRTTGGSGNVGGVDAGAAAWGKPPHWGWR